ncbi:MAG: hypothetical protein CME06_15100 [Gemmatimonadetes bacterium]|nr:hypothetical protein [Gemmatimonadota bacterium]
MIRFPADRLGVDAAGVRALHKAFWLTTRRVDRRRKVGRWGLRLLFLAAGVQASTHVDGTAAGDAAALLYLAAYFLPLVLLDHAAVLSEPYDLSRIGHLPVHRATYYLARLTTSTRLLAPMLAVFVLPAAFRAPGHLFAYAVAGAALCTALLMLANGIQRWFAGDGGRSTAQRRLALLQAATMLLYVGGLGGLRRLLGEGAEPPNWLTAPWQPTQWFASLGGPMRPGASPAAALAALLLAAAGAFLAFRPTSCAHRPPITTTTVHRSPTWRPPRFVLRWLFPGMRGVAVGRLLISHIRHDPRVFAQIAAVVPASALILAGTMADAELRDPFLSSGQTTTWGVLYAYILLVYVILCDGVSRSSNASAAWIFRAACVDPAQPFEQLQRIMRVMVFWPYLFALSGFLTLHHGHPLHAFLHGLLLALAAEVVVNLLRAIRPRHPFSEELGGGAQPVRLLSRNLLIAAVGSPLLLVVHHCGLRLPWAYVGALLLLTLLAASLSRLATARARTELA